MAGGRFQWVKPEIYPLLAVGVFSCSLGIYSMWRHLWTNPEVFPSRAYRQEGVPETEEMAKRARGYEQAIFRSIQEGRRGQAQNETNTRIF